jgi:hypothetical protein
MEEDSPLCEEGDRLRGMVLKSAGRTAEGALTFQSTVAAGNIDDAALNFAALLSSLTKCEAAYAAWSEHCAKHKCC